MIKMSRAIQGCYKVVLRHFNFPVQCIPPRPLKASAVALRSFNDVHCSRNRLSCYVYTFGFLHSISMFRWKSSNTQKQEQGEVPEKEEKVEESEEEEDLLPQEMSTERVIVKADKLYDEGRYEDLLALLRPNQLKGSVEILWRLSRCLYILSLRSDSQDEHVRLIEEGCNHLAAAMKLDENHSAVHKWYSILLDAKMAQQGGMSRLIGLSRVKAHMVKATELNPGDSSTLHMLGNWCFNMSSEPWYSRGLRGLVSLTYASTSYEEALEYFLRAEEMNPMFHSNNLLMLGITYLRLHKMEMARKYLLKAYEYPIQSEEDRIVSQRAGDMLKEISKQKPKKVTIFDTAGI